MPKTTLLRKQVTPTGTIQPHAGGTAPDGFLVCDGSIVNIADYPKLYAVIGTSWGHGNEVSPGISDGLTFHLPDLRGRFLRGSTENMDPVEAALRDPDYASRTASNIGGNTGDNVGSVQDDDYKSHRHIHQIEISNSYIYGRPNGNRVASFGGGTMGDPSYVAYTSFDGNSETRPINANVTYIIKVV